MRVEISVRKQESLFQQKMENIQYLMKGRICGVSFPAGLYYRSGRNKALMYLIHVCIKDFYFFLVPGDFLQIP